MESELPWKEEREQSKRQGPCRHRVVAEDIDPFARGPVMDRSFQLEITDRIEQGGSKGSEGYHGNKAVRLKAARLLGPKKIFPQRRGGAEKGVMDEQAIMRKMEW